MSWLEKVRTIADPHRGPDGDDHPDIYMTAFGAPTVRDEPEPEYDTYAEAAHPEDMEPCS